MATLTTERTSGTGRAPSPRPTRRAGNGNGEVFIWFFMRISGLVLVFLALGHMFIQHILYDVSDLSFAFVVDRWRGPFWRTWDGALLVLGLVHGTNGLRYIIDDYVRKPARRAALKALVYSLAAILALLGVIVLAAFDPGAL